MILMIAAPDTALERSSKLMARSFLRFKWKESLLWILFQLTPELTVTSITDNVGDPHVNPQQGIPNVPDFLSFLDKSGAIPFSSNPHSIFVFSSLQNFVAGVYDTINANLVLADQVPVGPAILLDNCALTLWTQLVPEQLPHLYRQICQLTPTTINQLSISEFLRTILLQSVELRDLRRTAVRIAHQAKNATKSPGEISPCHTCHDQPSAEQCIRIIPVKFTDRGAMSGSAIVPHQTDDPDSVLPKVN